MQLDSISALVTGGSSGLGLATVRRLRAAGARVGIADLNPPSDEDLASLGAGWSTRRPTSPTRPR